MIKMCYIITDGENYISTTGGIKSVHDISKATAMQFDKANNVLKTIPKPLQKFNWIIEQVVDSIDPIYDIDQKVNELEIFIKDLHERNKYLNFQLSTVDKEIVDIEHAAEFYSLNASQGYKLYKMLHDAKVRRREIKDEMEKIKYIMNSNMKGALYNNISGSIKGLKNRQYAPRVLQELFGNQ
jgi:hypothetical protein